MGKYWRNTLKTADSSQWITCQPRFEFLKTCSTRKWFELQGQDLSYKEKTWATRIRLGLQIHLLWNGQNLTTKSIVTLGYKLTQYLFIGGEFWQIHRWITSSSYILHVCKISRKLKINSYIINKFLNCKFL